MAFSRIANAFRWKPWLPRDFSAANPTKYGSDYYLEEENLPDYLAERYYPASIGEILQERYQIVGKLGYGVTSTAWLVRDLIDRRRVALKIFVKSSSLGSCHELTAYQRMHNGPRHHPGRAAIRTLLESFTISGPYGEHLCLLQAPQWGSIKTLLRVLRSDRLDKNLVASMLIRLLHALDYAQTCKVIHTDINPGNVMVSIGNHTMLEKFEQDEIEHPTSRKELDDRTIYLSRILEFTPTDFDDPVLCDFGEAALGEERHTHVAQPDMFRAPEVILNIPWSYEIDIWNLGCFVWSMLEGKHLFSGMDSKHRDYHTRAHLAEVIALLGPPPPDLILQGVPKSEFFAHDGSLIVGIEIPPRVSLEELETVLDDEEDKQLFLLLMKKMLQWNPQDRWTAKQLLQDEWVKKHSDL